MANYSTLKAAVTNVVKTNGAQEITGANLQTVLLSIIDSVGGGGYIFKGVATPSTIAGTPDQNVFYLAGAGTYANFGTSVTVPVGTICVFKFNGSWTNETITMFAGIDDVPTANSNSLVKSGGIDKNSKEKAEFAMLGSKHLLGNNLMAYGIWEHGSLDGSGLPTESTPIQRTRSSNFIPLFGTKFSYPVEITGNYVVTEMCFYDKNKDYIGAPTITPQGILFPNGSVFAKFVVRPNPDAIVEVPLNVSDYIKLDAVIPDFKEKEKIEISLSNYQGNIATPFYEYKNAIGIISKMRLTAEKFIKLEENTIYELYKVFSNNDTERGEVEFYTAEDNESYISDTGWVDKSFLFNSINYKYAKILYKYDNTENFIPENIVPPYILRKIGSPIASASLFNTTLAANWIQGSINNQGEEVESTIRIHTNFIHVDKATGINVSINSSFLFELELYDKNFGFIGSTYYQSSLSNYALSDDIEYMRVLVKRTNEAALTPSDASSLGLTLTTSIRGEIELNKIVVAQWNVGLYNAGVTPTGIPNDQLDAKLPEIRNILTQLGADILIANEDVTYIDRNRTLTAYDALYRQFYPYRVSLGSYVSIYSKYSLSAKVLASDYSDRKFTIAKFEIGDKVIPIVAVHLTPYNTSDRQNEESQLIAYLNGESRYLLVGDMNIGNNSLADVATEIGIFTAAGLKVANCGYWGNKVTCPSVSAPTDNIVVKDMYIDSFDVIENVSVSDHYPIVSKVSF